ncbi:hypothetical protein [Pseudomonas synxantha]|uniref:Uncharacterized protein n=1 Tax=Pseudomonas synxantha TaxID=47883 RepID=A0ACC6JVY5_9PSED|nr:hypothetical protein [Pseudomonas synxantha]MDR6610545.1 hypothetical protein [Pseudomonas synxantha]
MNPCAVSQLSPLNQSHKQYGQVPDKFEGTAATFLYAWKQGVALAGPTYFGDGTHMGLNHANCRWDLRPDLLMINNAINVLSDNERIFLAALVSFYDTDEGSVLLKQAGVRGLADLGVLDPERRAVISSLVLHHHGW